MTKNFKFDQTSCALLCGVTNDLQTVFSFETVIIVAMSFKYCIHGFMGERLIIYSQEALTGSLQEVVSCGHTDHAEL